MATDEARLADAAADSRFANAHHQLVSDGSIQFDLPRYVPPQPPSWLKPLAEFLEWLSPAFPYLFWGAVAALVLTILYFVGTNFGGFGWPWQRGAEEAKSDSDWRPDAAQSRILLGEADALAAQGHYAEAARLLLRRSVEDIAERLPQFLKPSLTARDIAAADALPAPARPAFSAIARVVEVSAFGSRSVTADAWADCRRAYGDFAIERNWAHG